MTPTRGVVLLLVVLILFGVVAQMNRGSTAASRPHAAGDAVSGTSTPEAHDVARALAAVERAFNAGDVPRLCRPDAVVDAAVIRQQNHLPGGCEAELEGLMGNEPPLRLNLRRLGLRPDLASATVTTSKGRAVPVDLVRRGQRWLLSFSGEDDPMPVIAGAT